VKLNRIDLNLLVAFDALMSERNVTRAAERLSIGQPAMSASLARLRKLLDDPILVREGAGLAPTPIAESLIGPVHEALVLIESALGTRRSFEPERDERTFSIIASDYVVLVLLQSLFTELAAEAPHVRIHVTPVVPDFLDQLRRGSTDLVILPREVAEPAARRICSVTATCAPWTQPTRTSAKA
jgi:DNA-binding transcriptional LysR family regulator